MLGNSRRWRFLLVSGAKTGLDGGEKRSRRPRGWLVKRIRLPSRRFLRGEFLCDSVYSGKFGRLVWKPSRDDIIWCVTLTHGLLFPWRATLLIDGTGFIFQHPDTCMPAASSYIPSSCGRSNYPCRSRAESMMVRDAGLGCCLFQS